MSPRSSRSRVITVSGLTVLALVAAGCRTGADITMWGPCTPGNDPTGTDGHYAMVCQSGVWTPIMTVDEFARISRGEPGVVIAPVPTKPAVPATTTTTAPPATTVPPSTTVPVPPPTVTSMTPDRGSTEGGTSVTITGTNFVDVTSVSFDGTPLGATMYSVVDATTITAVTPAAVGPGSVDVTVTTATGAVTLTGGHTYGPPPALGSFAPALVDVNGNRTMTLYGDHLTGLSSITIGGHEASILDADDDTVVIQAPLLPLADYDLVITTPYGSLTWPASVRYTQ